VRRFRQQSEPLEPRNEDKCPFIGDGSQKGACSGKGG
jgi:hypothetical protein